MKDLVSRCPIEEVMQVISGRWPGLLIYYLKQGTKRFNDLRRDNPTISHRMLTLELRKLDDARVPHPSEAKRRDTHTWGKRPTAADSRTSVSASGGRW